jgi:perosamine synthetase
MTIHDHGSGTSISGEALAKFTCSSAENIWSGIEKALDNGYGVVAVLGPDGTVRGRATLARMRAALSEGRHLHATSMDSICEQPSESAEDSVRIVLDRDGRLQAVTLRPEADFLPVAEPNLSRAEFRNLIDAYLSTWISSTGDYIRQFERRFAEKVGTSHGVATSNGTTSLHLALVALGIGEGDEVIVPDLTFAASANTVIMTGARPVLVDVDPNTWCISVESIERAITPRTRAVMPVHVFGRTAPMTEIRDLCHAHGLYVIEDCAEAHGARYDNQPVGSFSDVASFSFFANKIITSGEGGICVTNDPDLARRMQILRDHGMAPERRYWHEEVGYNYRMTNLQASVGCAQLERMDEFLETRKAVHELYREAMADIPGVLFPSEMSNRCQPVTWFSCALVPAGKRADLIKACKHERIDLRPFFNSLSAMPAYRRYARVCPVSRSLSVSGVNLPTSHKVDARIADKMATIFRSVLG